jgi:hypothetical protein
VSAEIGVFLYILFGTPAEDRDAARRTRDFVAALEIPLLRGRRQHGDPKYRAG